MRLQPKQRALPSFARLGLFDFRLGFARGSGKTGQACEGARPYTNSKPVPTQTLSPDHVPQGRLIMDNQRRALQFRHVASAELGEQAGDRFAAGAHQL